jgi:Tfp pilus assembly protein PilO
MNPKKFFYVLAGLLAALVIAGGAAYYLASQSLHTGTVTLSHQLGDEQIVDQKVSQLEDLDKQYQRLKPSIPAIFDALPDQKLQSQIALQLRSIAGSSGMKLDTINFTASTAPGPVSQTVQAGSILAVPVTFQLKGSYDQLQRFLDQQEHLNRYSSITSLGITSSGSSLSYDITLNVFIKP